MKTLLLLATLSLGTALMAANRAPAFDVLSPGSVAPEIEGDQWFNHIGRPLSLAELRGQAVLLEFWATW